MPKPDYQTTCECDQAGFHGPYVQKHYPIAWRGAPVCSFLALIVLLLSGVTFRAVRAQVAVVSGTKPIAPGTLSGLPLTIGEWRGIDVPLDEVVIKATDSEDHINRLYTLLGSDQRVSLFLSYGTRFRDLMPHRPGVCYPGAGWSVEGHRVQTIGESDVAQVPCQIHHFSRGGLQQHRMAVLNFYVVGGDILADVAELRSAVRSRARAIPYVVQVQIAAGGATFDSWADDRLFTFTRAAAPIIVEFLNQTVGN